MESPKIPTFLRNFGHRIFSHILNIEEEVAIRLINFNENFVLDAERSRYLDGFISICRRQRLEYFDEDTNNIDRSLFELFTQMVLNDRHVFNIWREELGGNNFKSTSEDPLIIAATDLALEIYPVFLIKNTVKEIFPHDNFIHVNRLIYKLVDKRNKICMEMMKDASISKLFTYRNENDRWSSYVSSGVS